MRTREPIRRRRAARVVERTAYLGLATTILLELVLQAGAVGVWLSTRDDTVAKHSGGTTVMCVGDSFTFGVGASTSKHSYPSVLERELRRRSGFRDVRVVNFGMPGRNSRELLLPLDDQLEATKPRVVCILVGANDRWKRPPLLEPDVAVEAAGGFEFRWRTKRLVELFLFNVSDEEVVDSSHRPQRTAAPHDTELPVATGPTDPPREPLLGDLGPLVDEACQALESGEVEIANQRLHTLLDRHDRQPSERSARGVLDVLNAIGDRQRALELAIEYSAEFDHVPQVWETIGSQSLVLGRDEQGRAAYAKAVELISDKWPKWRASVLGGYAQSLWKTDARKAFSLVLDSLELDRSRAPAVLLMNLGRSHIERAEVQRMMNARELSSEARAAAEFAVSTAYDDPDGYLRILEQHVRRAITKIRAAGAVPVLLNYPRAFVDRTRAVFRDLAVDTGVVAVDIAARFEQELETRDREELFVPDNHCNDAGYELMGRLVADEVANILASLGSGR